ncbi:unnamed protein product [Bursaphelenchus xylophilus]|uniref:(pine wood nematode) hypothetical protein n=1 Tax=Bursaphelenchus xylophilus TaxID=6326 RepID=A0A1I7RNA3_BURXY|nr:unnamed protein product [Bursaphelenchus xylophilus]CAG9123806.1 unnamed protein product [Bursaphelenchus xylophilus]
MDEPLLLFRDYVQNRISMKEMNVNGQLYYVFGETAFPANCNTALQVLGQDKVFYTLEAVIQCWNMREREHNFYVREVSGKSIQVVTLLQRRKLTAYLAGDTDSVMGLVPNAPYSAGIPLSQLETLTEEHNEPEAKRLKLSQTDNDNSYNTTFNFDTTMEGDSQPSQDEGIRALNADLDADKIAQLRNRVKKNLKKAPVNLAEDVYDPIAEFPFEDASEDEVGLALKEIETPGCSRIQIYNCEGLDLESVMEHITEEINKKNRPPQNNSFIKPQLPTNGGIQKKPTSGYSRYDQEVFRPELDTDLEIDMDLSFRGNTKKANPIKPTLMQPPKPPQRLDFGPVSALNPNGRPPKRQSKTPIIVIPASGTALITMYNAEDILQDMKFVSSEERKKQKSRRENELLIHRRKENGTTVPFRIIEDPRKLREDEWDRVVAVFVQGPAWQFKGWRFGSHPTEIFARIAAFHLKFDEQPLDKNVAQWSVNVLSLSQTKRHLDRAVLNKFWTTLDRYMVKNKPHLRF